MQVKPRGKYILIKPDENKLTLTSSGLSKPENEEVEEKSTGIVISVGDIKDIKKGDHIVYGVLAGENIKIKEVDYKLLHDEDIIAFIK